MKHLSLTRVLCLMSRDTCPMSRDTCCVCQPTRASKHVNINNEEDVPLCPTTLTIQFYKCCNTQKDVTEPQEKIFFITILHCYGIAQQLGYPSNKLIDYL